MMTVLANIFSGPQLKATIFLICVGLLLVAALVALYLAWRAGKLYRTEELPMLPGMEDTEEAAPVEEEAEVSVFHLEDEEELHSKGDKEAVDLYREMKAASANGGKKKKTGLFGKKS